MAAQSIADFLDYFEKIRARTLRVVRCIPAEKLEWTCRPGQFTLGDIVRHLAAVERYVFAEGVMGRPVTTWKLLRAMVEHEVHHRWQIYTYLGILGVPRPPLYGLTSEELRERGQTSA